MTQVIHSIKDVAAKYDVIVFDQWGVLHDGTSAYPDAVQTISGLGAAGKRLGILSNSGKRAAPNAQRIAGVGFDMSAFTHVMTSGEALWLDIARGAISARAFHPIERAPGDAAAWADGLPITITAEEDAEAILLMGLPDGSEMPGFAAALARWMARGLPIYCSNPDRKSPRAGGGLVISPGALAFAYQEMGGRVVFYGKPHVPIFRSIEVAMELPPQIARYLMVGDSLEHDIAGAQTAGWDSLLIQGGLYADAFAQGEGDATLARLVAAQSCRPPTFRMKDLR